MEEYIPMPGDAWSVVRSGSMSSPAWPQCTQSGSGIKLLID